jgi:ABC-type phosphate transport system auxiliary subunit
MDWLLGPKKVKRTRKVSYDVTDDSRRQAWINAKTNIQNSTQAEIDRYQTMVDADTNRIKNSERKLKRLTDDQNQIKNDLTYYKNKLEQDKSTLDNLKSKVNRELLDALRHSTLRQLAGYCDFNNGEVSVAVKKYIDDTVNANRKVILEKTAQYYDERFEALLAMYRSEINGKKQDVILKIGDYSAQIEEIKKIRGELAYE